jgi:5-methyltetrahydrofolate--homocysteine methyltransferase
VPWRGLRQQAEKTAVDGVMRPSRCLSDFVARKVLTPELIAAQSTQRGTNTRKQRTYIGVLRSRQASGLKKEKVLNDDHDDSSIMLKALADRWQKVC